MTSFSSPFRPIPKKLGPMKQDSFQQAIQSNNAMETDTSSEWQ